MFAFVAKVDESGSWIERIAWNNEEGLGEMYRTIGCDLVEIAGTGELAGVPVILWVDEEGLYHEPVLMNLAACDLLAEASNSAPAYLVGGGLVGKAILLVNLGSDHRGFTADEADKISGVLVAGGYTIRESVA
jgi:hypothetical protein